MQGSSYLDLVACCMVMVDLYTIYYVHTVHITYRIQYCIDNRHIPT